MKARSRVVAACCRKGEPHGGPASCVELLCSFRPTPASPSTLYSHLLSPFPSPSVPHQVFMVSRDRKNGEVAAANIRKEVRDPSTTFCFCSCFFNPPHL